MCIRDRLTTVCYKIGDDKPIYALEGSIAVTGSLVQWLRDNLKMFSSAPEIEELAASVDDNGGCYFVPAFSGLFAPYWRADARGAIVGLTRYVNRGHIARAVLEATAYQTREVLEAMEADSGVKLAELKVDGGMTANETLMQFQADQVGAVSYTHLDVYKRQPRWRACCRNRPDKAPCPAAVGDAGHRTYPWACLLYTSPDQAVAGTVRLVAASDSAAR